MAEIFNQKSSPLLGKQRGRSSISNSEYVKSLVDRRDRRIENWRNISEWLETDGYRCRSSTQVPLDSLLPEKSTVSVTNINIENHQLVIVFNLRIPTSKSEGISVENFGLSDDVIPKDIARDLSEKC
ncbi:MAG: hypothetical protein F6K39_09555 [Okeania sp. SIO3B3]|nr:hypothetical protein [Okeania sp. SIO3B3]